MKKISDAVDRFCYLHPRFGIPNLMKYIVFGNILVFLLAQFSKNGFGAVSFLAFSWEGIKSGELWRLVTFIFVPSFSRVFSLVLSLYFYYLVGNTLEREWGTAKFTIYYTLGILLTVLGAILAGILTGTNIWITGAGYLNLSLFFAFAMLYPDMQILLFFLIPVKMKWLGLANAAWFALNIIRALLVGSVSGWLIPLMALLNFLIFFSNSFFHFAQRQRHRSSGNTIHFQNAVRKQNQQAKAQGYRHKCSVCGRTDAEYPNLQFRYCSRCAGYHCFCEDHIFNHEHFTE